MPYLGGSGPGGSGSAYARPAPPPPPPRPPVPRAPGQSGQVYTPPAPPPVARPLGQSHEVYTPPPTRPSLGAAVGRAVSRTATAASHPLVQASSRATQRLAMALASRGRERIVPTTAAGKALINLYGGADRAFHFPLDPITRDSSSSLARNLAVQGQFNQDFANLQKQGLLPVGVREPRLNFLGAGQGAGRFGELSYEKNGQIYISPFTATQAVDPAAPFHAWGQQGLVHELAHTMQSPQTLSSVPTREGGAQAFADAAAPAVIGPISENDTNYTGYVNQVRNALGPAFFMSGQFNAPTQYAGNVPLRQRRRQQ